MQKKKLHEKRRSYKKKRPSYKKKGHATKDRISPDLPLFCRTKPRARSSVSLWVKRVNYHLNIYTHIKYTKFRTRIFSKPRGALRFIFGSERRSNLGNG